MLAILQTVVIKVRIRGKLRINRVGIDRVRHVYLYAFWRKIRAHLHAIDGVFPALYRPNRSERFLCIPITFNLQISFLKAIEFLADVTLIG